MTAAIAIRPARESDVRFIVAMLADDPLGNARERIEDPLPESYFKAFERLDRDPNIHLVVAQDGEGAVVGCLQLCILPGLSRTSALPRIAAAAALAKRWSNGRSQTRARRAASWSSC